MASVLITGGRGFLGQSLAQEILKRGGLQYCSAEGVRESTAAGGGEGGGGNGSSHFRPVETVVVLDVNPPDDCQGVPGLRHVVGDISDASFISTLFATYHFHSIFHLAAVLSGLAESDFDLGMKVNIDATRTLLECCRRTGGCPRLVMTSSVAVFGSPSVSGKTTEGSCLTEDSPVLPHSSYGMEKAVCELLLMDASRRGFVDGRAVRLPTVVVRPGRSTATSSFCSSIIREPLNGERAICPVPRDLPLWIQSPPRAVANIIHAHNVELGSAAPIITLPGLTTTPAEMVEALSQCGADSSLVDWVPDEFLTRVVGSWPGSLETPTALSLGFQCDQEILSIVKSFISTLETQDKSQLKI